MSMIKEVRKQAGLTMKQVSELTGVPLRSIQNWEGGVRQCPPYIERMVVEKIVESTKRVKVIYTPEGCLAAVVKDPEGNWNNFFKIPVVEGKISIDAVETIATLASRGYKIEFNL